MKISAGAQLRSYSNGAQSLSLGVGQEQPRRGGHPQQETGLQASRVCLQKGAQAKHGLGNRAVGLSLPDPLVASEKGIFSKPYACAQHWKTGFTTMRRVKEHRAQWTEPMPN